MRKGTDTDRPVRASPMCSFYFGSADLLRRAHLVDRHSRMIGIPSNFQRAVVFHRILCHRDGLNGKIRGDLIHNLRHHALHHGAQTTGANLAVQRLLGNGFQRLGLKLQLNAIKFQKLLILLDQSILRFGENPHHILFGEALETGNHGKPSNQLRNDAEFQDIVGLHLCKQLANILLSPVSQLPSEAKSRGIGTLFDDLVQTVKRAAANKQNIAGINGDKLLLGMLPSTLRRNIGNRTLNDFQQRLLNALAADVAGNGGILAFPGPHR